MLTAPKPKLWRSCRFSISFCIFLASAQTSFLRDSAGMALICMSKPQNNITCDSNDAVVPTLPWLINKKNCEFNWDAATRGRLLAAYQYGYIATTMVGGYMSNHFGAKTPFMCSGFGSTLVHVLCPLVVLAHTEAFFASRVLQGMFSGLMVGPFFELFGAWVPDDEIPTLLSFSFSGFMIGTILAYPASGQLCDVNVDGFGGWPLIFYAPAGNHTVAVHSDVDADHRVHNLLCGVRVEHLHGVEQHADVHAERDRRQPQRVIRSTIGSLMLILSCFTLICMQNINKWYAISVISSILAWGEFAYSGGFYPTLLNMTPNFAGLLSGISTFFAYLVGTQSILINSIITEQNTKEEWNMVFWIIMSTFAFSMCFYLIFGSASLQKWSIVSKEEGRRSRSTLLMTKSYGASRNVSLRHPSHVF
ncbi:Major facilitator superfamily,Major facilitator superfamily domain [Cinara cedri]|uniref:Major facilitator superfamily,Major facilitator superfamily domain n=1 Tax=Cinara cedri TaxID=506608 RepID=A0A5E4NGF2_9HEMI|nr:Major facilitator superfamily,Major facilitator superfamily domain [Cinara cedri]